MDFETLFSLKNKRVLIQSPEHPYGEEIVKGFIAAGAQILICGEDQEILAKWAKEGQEVIYYSPMHESDAKKLVDELRSVFGECALDAFVHISPPAMLRGWSHSFEEIDSALQYSQLGLMLTMKHVGEYMQKQGRGSILFILDYAALVGCDIENCGVNNPEFSEDFALDYGFVKSSYVNYAKQAAGFLGAGNVRCNAIAYAPIKGMKNEVFENSFIRHSQLKRLPTEQDIQSPAIFFVSDAAAYITGVTLAVDGGYTAK